MMGRAWEREVVLRRPPMFMLGVINRQWCCFLVSCFGVAHRADGKYRVNFTVKRVDSSVGIAEWE